MATPFTPDLLERARRQTPIPGLAAAWVRAGEEPVFLSRGESRPGAPVTADTVFPVASITKTFTASLCALKVASGAWRWDTRIRDIWPSFALHDPEAAARMTLLDALTHRSGLPPHTWAWVFAPPNRGAYMRERLPHLASTGRYDEKVRYSNLMFALAGWLLEAAGGGTWENQVDRDLWHPLGLRSTRHATANWAEGLPGVALPHAAGKPIPPFFASENHIIAPASEVFSTARDLATWLQTVMSGEEFAPCFRPIVPSGTDRPHPSLGPLHYGIGWRVETLAGEPLVWHSGQCTGYTAWMGFQPRRKQGWVLLSNADGVIDTLQALAYALASGDEWFSRLPPPAPAAPPPALDPSPVPLPPGEYHDPGYGVFSVAKDGRGRLNDSQPGPARRDAAGALVWEIPGYGKRVPLEIRPKELHLALESALPPVGFVLG